MHRIDDSKYLLFLEFDKSLKEPGIRDELVIVMEDILSKAKTGTSNYSDLNDDFSFNEGDAWRGWHITDCGEMSTNTDYLLPNNMITNSLAPYYLEFYRNSIPSSEMDKIYSLLKFLNIKL